MTLREKIQFLRQRGYTQTQIQENTGIIQSSISRIENGAQHEVHYAKGAALDALIKKANEASLESQQLEPTP